MLDRKGVQKVRKVHGRKDDALSRTSIDAMEMQILWQILSRVDAKER